MSSIGLFDWDLLQWQQPIPFNLELMKMATYYKQRRHLVQLLKQFDSSRYTRVILRKDYPDDVYPPHIFNNPKVECGGLVFSGGEYKPMESDIEQCVPDREIYRNMEKYYQLDKWTRQRFSSMLHCPHVRLSLNGKTLWSDWEKQVGDINLKKTFSLIIHDKNLQDIDGAYEVITNFIQQLHTNGRRIGLKFPLDFYNDYDLEKWGSIKKIKSMSSTKLHYLAADEVLVDVTNYSPQEFIYIINSQNFDKKFFTSDTIIKIYKQLIFSGVCTSEISLKIEEENFLSPEWEKVLLLMNEYQSFISRNRPISMYEYAKRNCKWLKIDIINLFEFVRQENYPLFKLFYECVAVELKNGQLESRFIWVPNGGTAYDKR